MTEAITIYVLLLEDGRYFVGDTSLFDIEGELERHRIGKGHPFTSRYRPITVVSVSRGCDYFDVDCMVKRYMYKHGMDKVRGGSYSDEHLDTSMMLALCREFKVISGKYIRHNLTTRPNIDTSTIVSDDHVNTFDATLDPALRSLACVDVEHQKTLTLITSDAENDTPSPPSMTQSPSMTYFDVDTPSLPSKCSLPLPSTDKFSPRS